MARRQHVFLAGYPKHSLQVFACGKKRHCPWSQPKWFDEIPRSENVLPQDLVSAGECRHWVNSEKGPLLQVALLAEIAFGQVWEDDAVWNQEERFWLSGIGISWIAMMHSVSELHVVGRCVSNRMFTQKLQKINQDPWRL